MKTANVRSLASHMIAPRGSMHRGEAHGVTHISTAVMDAARTLTVTWLDALPTGSGVAVKATEPTGTLLKNTNPSATVGGVRLAPRP
jgi:hypothetical protein